MRPTRFNEHKQLNDINFLAIRLKFIGETSAANMVSHFHAATALLFFCLAGCVQSKDVSEPANQLTIKGITFWIEREKVDWATAVDKCAEKGARLAEIPSYEDYYEEIRKFVGLEEKRKPHFVGHGGPWIGLNNIHEESFQFSKGGQPIGLAKMWGPSQPDNFRGREHCAMIMRSASLNVSLNDAPCSIKLSYICSKVNQTQHCGPSNGQHQLTINGITFWIEREKVKWATAVDKCAEKGGRLAEIPSYADYFERISTFVKDEEQLLPYFVGELGPWVGLDDINHQGNFQYSDGGKPSGLDKMWNPGQPNAPNDAYWEDCVHFLRRGNTKRRFGLNDLSCGGKVSYMCSKNSSSLCSIFDV